MSSPPPNDQNKDDALARPAESESPSRTTSISGPDPTIIREFFELQAREIEVRQEEINLQKLERGNAHEYAKLSLDAQAKDRKDSRDHGKTERRDRLVFAAVIVLVLVAFVIIAIQLNQVEVAKELVKNVALITGGALAGYSYGSRKSKDGKSKE
jgi:hypothetical protein